MNFTPLTKDAHLKPFLHGASANVIKYYEIMSQVMDFRINTRLKDLQGEEVLLAQLEKLIESCTSEEISQLDKLPRRWWFQYSDENGLTQKSELDVYPYAQYFVDQQPHLLGDDVSRMKGKPYFGDKTWKPHMAIFYLMLEEHKGEEINLHMITMSNESDHYKELQDNYEFVRYVNKCPVFRKKQND